MRGGGRGEDGWRELLSVSMSTILSVGRVRRRKKEVVEEMEEEGEEEEEGDEEE